MDESVPKTSCSGPESFAHGVLAKRHPALIRLVSEAYPYGLGQRRALDALSYECSNGTMTPLDGSAFDESVWPASGHDYFGRPWSSAPLLWAEAYFYRRLLGAVGYFDPGPWQGVDPFSPLKRAELRGPAVEEGLAALDAMPDPPDAAAVLVVGRACPWGTDCRGWPGKAGCRSRGRRQ